MVATLSTWSKAYIYEVSTFWDHVRAIFYHLRSMFGYQLSVWQLAYFLIEIRQIQEYLQLWVRYLFGIFGRHYWTLVHWFQIILKFFVCLLVWQLAYFLNEIRQIQEYLQLWMRYLSECLWTYSLDVDTLVPNNSDFIT